MVDRPVPAPDVYGPIDLYRGAVLNETAVVARRVLEIDDLTMSRIVRIDFTVGETPEALVPPYLAEALTAERGRLHYLEFDAGELRSSVQREERVGEDGGSEHGRA